jgi:hypothetical protein
MFALPFVELTELLRQRPFIICGIGAAWIILGLLYPHWHRTAHLENRTYLLRVDESGDEQQAQIVIISTGDGSQKSVGEPDNYDEAAWSPDGRTIAALTPSRLHLIDASGDGEVIINLSRYVDFADWSPDSSRLAVADWSEKGSVQTYSRNGEMECDATVAATPQQGWFINDIGWSPDSRFFALEANHQLVVCAGNRLVLWDKTDFGLESGEDFLAAWQANNRLAIYVHRDRWEQMSVDFNVDPPSVSPASGEDALYIPLVLRLVQNASLDDIGIDSAISAVGKGLPSADGWGIVLTTVTKGSHGHAVTGSEREVVYDPLTGESFDIQELPNLENLLMGGKRDYSVYVKH